MQKLILRNHLCPGDIVMLTAAVRDLHRCQPSRFVTDVRTSCPDLWSFNPYITPIADGDPDARVIECEYPLVNESTRRPVHFIYGFVEFLARRLNVHIHPTEFKGDVYATPDAASSPDLPQPYWLIDAGGKTDFTAKWPDPAKLQAVVDEFAGRVAFVQIGAANHNHPRLRGVIDRVGATTIRGLVDLMAHASGVITPVSFPMHLSAAVPTPTGALRPCVVIAGGREPAHWEQYPGHAYLDTVGRLPCCANGACWRSRTRPMGDGNDKPDSLCVDVAPSGFPRCIDMISAQRIIDAVADWIP
ncbi:MAG TPA: hypothetical protein VGK19_21325 [Capsulimonadaceae bacterium]|jgi:ADP-heptose:LPS heptosyltransferase